MRERLEALAQKMPALALVGPRQSGKTTLARATFPRHRYISLEDLRVREFALQDPHGFFKNYRDEAGLILDEIQQAPELLSYVQIYADEYQRPGYFVLTGSQNFLMNEAITQTLAGRVAIFTLLPLSIAELRGGQLLPDSAEACIFKGQYPRVYDSDLAPTEWFPSYIQTYVERDVRSIRNITDLSLFQRFVGLCAGRIGQLLNITSLANDCGVTVVTARSWLTLLEASYLIVLLQPYHTNFGKRLVKTPKLYFYDTGLACSLLGIETSEQLMSHYLRGNLFESFIIADLFKQRFNEGRTAPLYFWRDQQGHEVDCLVVQGDKLLPLEIKAGKTVAQDYFSGLAAWRELAGDQALEGRVMYAGDEDQRRSAGVAVSWKNLDRVFKGD